MLPSLRQDIGRQDVLDQTGPRLVLDTLPSMIWRYIPLLQSDNPRPKAGLPIYLTVAVLLDTDLPWLCFIQSSQSLSMKLASTFFAVACTLFAAGATAVPVEKRATSVTYDDQDAPVSYIGNWIHLTNQGSILQSGTESYTADGDG